MGGRTDVAASERLPSRVADARPTTLLSTRLSPRVGLRLRFPAGDRMNRRERTNLRRFDVSIGSLTCFRLRV
jgi:hypothetical protein